MDELKEATPSLVEPGVAGQDQDVLGSTCKRQLHFCPHEVVLLPLAGVGAQDEVLFADLGPHLYPVLNSTQASGTCMLLQAIAGSMQQPVHAGYDERLQGLVGPV